MSVTHFALERVQGATNVSGEFTIEEASFTRRFVAIVDSVLDGPKTIYDYSLCPKLGSSYIHNNESVPFSVVKSVRCTPVGGRYDDPNTGNAGKWKWTVDVSYGLPEEEEQDQPNPGDNFARVSFDSEQYDVPMDRDLLDKPILNSAKMPFDPPPLKEDNRFIIRIEKTLPSFNFFFADNMMNAVNSVAFLGFPADTLRVTKISAQPTESAAWGFYYSCVVEMQYRYEEHDGYPPHQLNILDVGRYEWRNDQFGNMKHFVIKDGEGNPVVDPVPLNGDGRKKADNDPPVYLKYRRYPRRDFNSFGIYP